MRNSITIIPIEFTVTESIPHFGRKEQNYSNKVETETRENIYIK